MIDRCRIDAAYNPIPQPGEQRRIIVPHAVQVFRSTGRKRRVVRWLLTLSGLLNVGFAAMLVAQAFNAGCMP